MPDAPQERTLILSFVTPELVGATAGRRAGPYLAAVAGRTDLVIIRWDGAAFHDGELVVTPLFLAVPALPSAAELLP